MIIWLSVPLILHKQPPIFSIPVLVPFVFLRTKLRLGTRFTFFSPLNMPQLVGYGLTFHSNSNSFAPFLPQAFLVPALGRSGLQPSKKLWE